jgi:GT2 family glycosyltransferase
VSAVVAAIVLNWNGSHDSVRALESLARSRYPALRMILVDNGSAPEDLTSIKAACPDIVYLELAENHGFGRAVNLGAALALRLGAEHLLLFNNDAIIPDGVPLVERLVAELESSAAIGAAGPIIVDEDARLTVQAAGIALRPSFPAPRGVGRGLTYDVARNRTFRFDFLQGSCLLVRGTAFTRVNGMDPDFFFQVEEADLTLRLKAAGYRSSLVRDVYVVHRRCGTIGVASENYAYTLLRSLLIFLKKHARWYELPSAALTMLAVSVGLIGLCWRVRKRPALRAIARAWLDFFTGRWGGYAGTWAAGYTAPDFTAPI